MESSEIFQIIVKNLKQILPNIESDAIGRSTNLAILGTDSIGRADLIEKTMESFDLHVSRFEFHHVSNLGELADMFAQKLNER